MFQGLEAENQYVPVTMSTDDQRKQLKRSCTQLWCGTILGIIKVHYLILWRSVLRPLLGNSCSDITSYFDALASYMRDQFDSYDVLSQSIFHEVLRSFDTYC